MVQLVAAPLISGLGALGLSTTAATTIATAGLYVATSAASILLQMSMVEEPKQDIGTKLSAVIGGAVNQSIHFGSKETAGSFLYKNAWGKSNRVPNAFLVRVYCLGDRPVDGFDDYIWAGGKKCNYDPGETQVIDGLNVGHPINAFQNGGENRLWVKFHDGSQTSADNYLVGKFGSDPNRAWTNDHIGRGRPYMIVTQKYDKKEPSGEIDVTAVVKNARYYDWRNDSTNGGSGTERYGNYGTYSVDNGNPVRIIYNIMRGIYYGNEWMYGGQSWPKTRFDNDSWTAAANKCDDDVSIAGGGTQKRFRVGGEVDCSEEPWTVIERCLKACNGRIVESGGVFKIYVGGIGASVYSFTDDDIIVSEELTGRMFPTREKIANTVTGTYAEPANAGEAKAFKARFKQAYIDADGDVRKTTMDFEYVRDNRQAQRLATMALNDNRRFRTFVAAFWTQGRKLEPCDVVSWTSTRFGFTNKKFIVGANPLREDGIVVVNLREADANDANWSTSDEDEFETGVFDDIDPAPQSLTATVTSVPFTDDTGKNRRPAVRIEATLDDEYVDCRALRYQVRKRFGDQKLIHRGRSEAFFEPDNDDYGDISFTSASIAAFKNRQVQVRYKIEPESDRDTEWSDWADHTITLGDYGIDDDDTSDDLLAAPTGLSVTKVQEKDEDGTIRTYLELDCTAPGWAGAKATFVYEVDVTGRPKPFRVPSGDTAARFRVNRTNRLHTVRVKARMGSGQNSGWTAGISITPTKKGADASAITGVAINRKNGSNVITWDRISDPDNREVAIMAGTTNVLGSMTEIGRTKSTKWTDSRNIVKGTRIYYRLLPVDTSDNVGSAVPSSAVDDVETGIVLTDTDTAPLAAPTGISFFQSNRDLNADGSVDTALRSQFSAGPAGASGYEFQWADNNGQFASVRADTGVAWVSAVTTRQYQARWRTINWNGVAGPWSSWVGWVTPAPTTGAPPDPTGVSANGVTLGIMVSWSAVTVLDYAYSEVALSGSSSSPSSSDIVGTTTGTRFRSTRVGPAWPYVRHFNTSSLSSNWVRAASAPAPDDLHGSYIVDDTVGRDQLQSYAAGFIQNSSLGSSQGSVAVGPQSKTLLVLTFRVAAGTGGPGMTVNLGSKTYSNLTLENLQPYTFVSVENSGGTHNFSRSGGFDFTQCELCAIALY